MEIPELAELEDELRQALVVKAHELYVIMGGRSGQKLASAYLGHEIADLPSDLFTTASDRERIDVSRHEIWQNIIELRAMLIDRRFAWQVGELVVDEMESWHLDFLEWLLASIPSVPLGMMDGSNVRRGKLNAFFELSAAWLRLGQDIAEALEGNRAPGNIQIRDVALISGLNERSMRNLIGKDKPIASVETDKARTRDVFGKRAFVALDLIDTLDWLRSRADFEIAPLKSDVVQAAMEQAEAKDVQARIALVALLVNVGSIEQIAKEINVAPKDLRRGAKTKFKDEIADALRGAAHQFLTIRQEK